MELLHSRVLCVVCSVYLLSTKQCGLMPVTEILKCYISGFRSLPLIDDDILDYLPKSA